MSINSLLKDVLDPFGDPVVAGEYITQPNAPDPDRYYTFNTETYGANYADDEPEHEVAFVQVHFFCPSTFDSVERVLATKRALAAIEDATWPRVTNASTKDGQHIVFEFRYPKGVLD